MKVGHTRVEFPGIRWFMFLDGEFKGCRVLFPRTRYIRVALVSVSDYQNRPAIADRYISRDLPQEVRGFLIEDRRGYFLYNGTLGTLVKKLAPHGVVYVGAL